MLRGVNVLSANLCKLLPGNNIAPGAGRGAECKGYPAPAESMRPAIFFNLDAALRGRGQMMVQVQPIASCVIS